MIERFTVPKTEAEFVERAKAVQPQGAKAVIQGLDVKIKRAASALFEEKKLFEDIIKYHETGEVPERFKNGKGT